MNQQFTQNGRVPHLSLVKSRAPDHEDGVNLASIISLTSDGTRALAQATISYPVADDLNKGMIRAAKAISLLAEGNRRDGLSELSYSYAAIWRAGASELGQNGPWQENTAAYFLNKTRESLGDCVERTIRAAHAGSGIRMAYDALESAVLNSLAAVRIK